jgi:hypothetical protein
MVLIKLREAQAALISERNHVELRLRVVPDGVRETWERRARDLNRRIAHLTVQITRMSHEKKYQLATA